ncbi:hypothetical protein AKJ41_01165 [candidate division MSBL1 archaeon SCGC-AAA259O05]|uniref:5-amino-6-(D-ribitylamino)uracil--L-tyrosine 4-hydroxyphenyl transferase n=1 Tax=candidate division MSBL1 archaeon SCGC-AAA259O05 TaxID=1698271 RepID=A0A133V517_9EURY|nr:hypothetical protein AKJ41_01165 [candidate division MSBL1 archaeon SCGC-AAA259O05]
MKSSDDELDYLLKSADKLRERTVSDIVTYVLNRNINFTNVCTSGCKFCAFSRYPGDPGTYLLTTKQVSQKTREAVRNGATEICMQGGLHPSLKLENYIDYLRAIRRVSSNVHIHAFSPAEINHISRKSELDAKEVIKTLHEEGLDSIPGTAAEILMDRVRRIICPNKISVEKWEEIIKTSHELGIPTTSTLMYGHVETPLEIATHLKKLREIQKETGGFTELVLLPFSSQNTELGKKGLSKELDPIDHLRVHAVARIMLADQIKNIQASWVKLGPKLAQKTLDAGVNDLSGTLMEENITRSAGGKLEKMKPEEIRELIVEAGKIPRQRTTTYELIGG